MRPPAQVPPPSPTPAPPRSSPLVTLLLPAGLFSVPLSSPLLDVVGGFQQERSGLPVWLPSLSAQLWVPVLWSGVGSRCQDASHLACPLPSADGGGGGGGGWGVTLSVLILPQPSSPAWAVVTMPCPGGAGWGAQITDAYCSRFGRLEARDQVPAHWVAGGGGRLLAGSSRGCFFVPLQRDHWPV